MALQLLKERSDLRNVVSASTVISACAKVEIEIWFFSHICGIRINLWCFQLAELVFATRPGPGDRDRFVLVAGLARRNSRLLSTCGTN